MNFDESYFKKMPDEHGFFGPYGGSFLPEEIQKELDRVTEAYYSISKSHAFITELRTIRKHFQGRPTPIYFCQNLSEMVGGRIYLKREDLNHSGAHKLNHCMGEVLLAKYLGKTKVIAETGAGQHGVALAMAAAHFGMKCDIYMGAVDVAKQQPNVVRMKLLGARVIPVTEGLQTLKEAVDAAFVAYLKEAKDALYCIGSVVGPHPFPMLVRELQKVVGIEAREQFLEMTGELPDAVFACVGGGSNAAGIFSGFVGDSSVELHGVEPGGRNLEYGNHAASITLGKMGELHGFKSYTLQDENGNPAPVYSIASGLDYPGTGPEHCLLKDVGRAQYEVIDDNECLDAFYTLSKVEGIIPALESSHAVAGAMRYARNNPRKSILVNLSGRGDKDVDFVISHFGLRD